MRSYNKVILIGRLGKDPERKDINGHVNAAFSMATSRPYKVGDEWKEETQWHNITCWRELAERITGDNGIKKGDGVLVEGELQYRTYEGTDGVTKYFTQIQAAVITVMERHKDANATGAPAAAAVVRQPAPVRQPAQAAPAGAGYQPSTDPDLPF